MLQVWRQWRHAEQFLGGSPRHNRDELWRSNPATWRQSFERTLGDFYHECLLLLGAVIPFLPPGSLDKPLGHRVR